MPVFFYQGSTRQGRKQQGELLAHSAQDAVRTLRERNVAVLRIREKRPSLSSKLDGLFMRRVGAKDLVAFTHQFAALVKAGVPLMTCLDMLSAHAEHPRFRAALQDIQQKVGTGNTLAQALRIHPTVFPESYIGLIEVGEAGGLLDRVLTRLALHQQKLLNLRRMVLGALLYPFVIIVLASLVMVFLLGWVIPIFGTIFSDFKATLPWPTIVVLEMSRFVQEYGWAIFVGFVVVAAGLKRGYGTRRGRFMADRMVLRVPKFGDLIQKTIMVQMTRTLGTLLESGVPISEALDITARSIPNRAVAQSLQSTLRRIQEGIPLAEPLAHSGVFPPMVIHMIGVGETTGSLDTILQTLADLYEEEVDGAVKSLSSLLEPLIMIGLGIGIGFFVLAMYLPIFSMSSVMAGM